MNDQKQAEPPFETLTPDVFVGGAGHIVICQEWTSLDREQYLRIIMHPRDAEMVAMKILAAAREARAK